MKKYMEIEKYFYTFQPVSIYFNFRELLNIYRSIDYSTRFLIVTASLWVPLNNSKHR
jgi:hypothetical protein